MHSEAIIRINKVIDRIEKELSNDHSLSDLAETAHMSKFHFHRTFKLITRETPHEYIARKRIEKIASLFSIGDKRPVSELASAYGFQNLSSFSRAFKKYYGCSATQFRKKLKSVEGAGILKNSKIGKTLEAGHTYLYDSEKLKNWMAKKAQIEVRLLPEVKVAYVRHWGSPYTVDEAFEKLGSWTANRDEQMLGAHYILFHDNPNLTEEYKIQQSACVEIKNGKVDKGTVSMLQIPSQKYAVGKFELTETEFELAWNSMILWLNEKNLRAKDGYRFEKFQNNSLFDESKVFRVEIGIPV